MDVSVDNVNAPIHHVHMSIDMVDASPNNVEMVEINVVKMDYPIVKVVPGVQIVNLVCNCLAIHVIKPKVR